MQDVSGDCWSAQPGSRFERPVSQPMTTGLFFTQLLNGLQLGVLLFLLSAGLTLVFGIMNVVNLAHGSLYMMGAYFAAAGFNAFDGSFLAAALVAIPGTLLLGAADRTPGAAPTCTSATTSTRCWPPSA